MLSQFSPSRCILAMMLVAPAAFAETNGASAEIYLSRPPGESLNRFGLSYRMGLNISAQFKNLGGYVSPNIQGQYDNGYNFTDINGNVHGNETGTWFWGYENANQIQNDALVLSSASAPANLKSKNLEEDPQHGIELTYNREFGRIEKWRWGIEAAIGFTDVTIHDNRRLIGNAVQSPFAYPLQGTVPPNAPYEGTYEGPGPLISPDGTALPQIVIPNGATVAGRRQFDSQIYGLRLGPYLEYPFEDKWLFSLSGGLSFLCVNSDFSFRETVTIATVGSQSRRGSGSHSDLMPGYYLGGNLQYAICKQVDLFTGVQYQSAGTYTHKESGKKAELNLGESIFVSMGLGFSF